MKLVTTYLFILLFTSSQAQFNDLSSLPAYDCSLKKIIAMTGRQTFIVTPGQAKGLNAMVDDYYSTFGNNGVRRKESELKDPDYLKDILMVGVLSDFKHLEKLKIPIRMIHNGFIVNNKSFMDKLDGFAYVDTNRIVISGNSIQALKDVQLAVTGGHDLLITQKGKITFFGNRKGNTFQWYNLQDLKNINYLKKSSPFFSAIYVSKSFKDTIDYQQLNNSLATYVQQFLSIYKISLPENKVSWFIHSNMKEYGTMSGMFGLTCPGNNSAGFSIRNEIHTLGGNTGLLKHEYSHFIFDNNIPQDHNPAFFVEGCVEYVSNINDSIMLRQRIQIAKDYRDSLQYTDLIINNRDFYGPYSGSNYSACGVFVKYLIDLFGVDALKSYCLATDKRGITRQIFKVSFDDLIAGYKEWLESQ